MEFDLAEIKSLHFWRAALAEYFASLLFLIAVSLCVLNNNLVSIALAIGLAITTLVMNFGAISGGHINPAVTLAMLIARKITWIRCLVYIICQCLGAITGSAISYGIAPEKFRSGMGVTNISAHVTPAQGFCIEMFFTMILVFTIFSAIDPKRAVDTYGVSLAIGIAVVVSHLSAVPLTGSSINPARSFGPAIIMNSWKNHWIYWIGPMLGGSLAAVLYEFVFYIETNQNEATENEQEGSAVPMNTTKESA